jgi:hypothetical protein
MGDSYQFSQPHGNFVLPENSRKQAICHFLNARRISNLCEEQIHPAQPWYLSAKRQNISYQDSSLAILHGPRKLADYDKNGKLLETKIRKAA